MAKPHQQVHPQEPTASSNEPLICMCGHSLPLFGAKGDFRTGRRSALERELVTTGTRRCVGLTPCGSNPEVFGKAPVQSDRRVTSVLAPCERPGQGARGAVLVPLLFKTSPAVLNLGLCLVKASAFTSPQSEHSPRCADTEHCRRARVNK